ncbi:hypothetical protein CQW23_32876 [Capsicum baccatum]|uniref:Ubiquitin-like protease family profile domain-containing protein n=1 Tax=Capsicum baccatum TaxID=33114 RepID=A0A2G2V3F9_CAPBA|nr:hypothetical protein CQW23_32876 [Capsicum baccatum]
MKSSSEIHKLTVMLPTYLSDSGFLEETTHTDWTNLDTYRDKMSQRTQLMNQRSFKVEYVQNITQQECDNLDCGVFVSGYAKYLSKGMGVPSVGFEAEYHLMRYASLLQNYSLRKAKKCPPRPRIKNLPLPDETRIVSIE